MADFLSGVSVGAHKGLADLVASKRQNRQMARQQRAYENEMMFRIGSAAQSQRNQERAFAFQKAEAEAKDRRWKQQFGLMEDEAAERRRANLKIEEHRENTLAADIAAREAADADRDADRAQRQTQFEDRMADDWLRFDETMVARQEENAAAAARFDREMEHKEATLAETMAGRKERNELTRGYYQSQQDYWDDQIRLKEEELAQANDPLEIKRKKAEIDRLKAQAEYYRSPRGTTGTPPKLTAGQIDESLDMMAGELVKEYTDFGGWFTGRLPWTDPSGRNERGTQPEMLHKLGIQAFNKLMERFNDPAQAELHLERLFDRMITFGVGVEGRDFGTDMRNDIIAKHPNPVMSDREKLEDARRMFVNAWRSNLAEQLGGGTTPNTDIRNMTVPRNTNDFRNRGVR